MNGSRQFVTDFSASMQENGDWGQDKQVLICPPSIYLDQLNTGLEGSPVKTGAQNLHDQDSGAYTGELSSHMLADLGVQTALIGHSERRAMFSETEDWVAAKTVTAINAGLTAVVCVGETLEERENEQTEACVSAQLNPVLNAVKGMINANNFVVAYEPVWAIGTGVTATPPSTLIN